LQHNFNNCQQICCLFLELTVSVVCFFLSTGNHHVSCPTPPIEAEEGDVAELQCRLDPSVDLRKETLDFTRADINKEVVHAYRHEKDQTDPQMDQYRDRTTLIHEDLIRGIISLNISSLNLTDSGLYTCYVPDLEASCTMNVTVGDLFFISPQHFLIFIQELRRIRGLVPLLVLVFFSLLLSSLFSESW
uniref:Immunoglobulin domain-containing protein n=1 Tax=Lates calcarifer TaxID=8187 RepID=A0A4W6DSY3_LATCA